MKTLLSVLNDTYSTKETYRNSGVIHGKVTKIIPTFDRHIVVKFENGNRILTTSEIKL